MVGVQSVNILGVFCHLWRVVSAPISGTTCTGCGFGFHPIHDIGCPPRRGAPAKIARGRKETLRDPAVYRAPGKSGSAHNIRQPPHFP